MVKMKTFKLGELLSVKHGFPFKGEFFKNSGKYIVLTPANFYEEGGFKETPGKEKYYSGLFPKEYICKKGDLIVVMTQQAEGLLGSTAFVPVGGKYLHNQRIGLITTNREKLLPDFANYLFRTNNVRKQIRDSASGSKVKHTSPEKIYNVVVDIPDISLQERISALLNALDDKIALNKRINDKLEAMAKRLYDYWFVQFDFPDENGHPYKSSGGKMVWNETLKREIPEGWKVKRIDEIANIFNGSTPATDNQQYYGGDIVWITPKDLSDQNSKFVYKGARNITVEGYNSCSTTIIPKGSIVMSSRAPIGLLSIAQCDLCTNQGFKNLVPKHAMDSYYLYYTLKSNIGKIQNLGTGTTFKEVSKDDLGRFSLLYPSNDITSLFTNKLTSLFAKQLLIEKQSARLMSLRDRLLPLLMNGQVEVK